MRNRTLPSLHRTSASHKSPVGTIFFGLSFGDIDYPYFQMFFKDRCDEEKYYGNFSKKRIVIFTRDMESGRDIKFQLMKMNNNKLMQMYNFNTLKFFYTKEGVTEDLKNYIKELFI